MNAQTAALDFQAPRAFSRAMPISTKSAKAGNQLIIRFNQRLSLEAQAKLNYHLSYWLKEYKRYCEKTVLSSLASDISAMAFGFLTSLSIAGLIDVSEEGRLKDLFKFEHLKV